MFADHGYAGARLDDIAGAAGIRKSSLLHHFGSKQALYLEALAWILGDLGSMVDEAASGPADFVARLDRLSAVITDYLGGAPAAGRVLFREVMDRGPFFVGPGGSVFETVLQTAVGFLEEGMQDGAFERQDTRQLVMSIVGVHLTWFTVGSLTATIAGLDPFADDAVEARRTAVVAHVRRLCGVG